MRYYGGTCVVTTNKTLYKMSVSSENTVRSWVESLSMGWSDRFCISVSELELVFCFQI